MFQPSFKEIWTRSGWSDFFYVTKVKQIQIKSRKWYQVRSLVRITMWFGVYIVFIKLADRALG
jgi:hypothetical protein